MAASTANIRWRVKNAALQAVIALNLTSDNPQVPSVGSNVFSWITWDGNNNVWPAVVLMYEDLAEKIGSGDSEHRSLEPLPLGCVIVDEANASRQHEREAVYLAWRETLVDAFHQQRPFAGLTLSPADPTMAQVYCTVDTQRIWDGRAREFNRIASPLVLNFTVKYPR
jgi:hypothetical protein